MHYLDSWSKLSNIIETFDLMKNKTFDLMKNKTFDLMKNKTFDLMIVLLISWKKWLLISWLSISWSFASLAPYQESETTRD